MKLKLYIKTYTEIFIPSNSGSGSSSGSGNEIYGEYVYNPKWELVELGDKVNFPLNKIFENLDNPTQYISDYSKTIEIPYTKKNNYIFNHIHILDSLVTDVFDPSESFEYKLFDENNILIEGVGHLLKMKEKRNGSIYEINLQGALNKSLNDLLQYTWSYSEQDKQLPELLWNNSVINKTTVINSWNQRQEDRENYLNTIDESTYISQGASIFGTDGVRNWDIIQWAPVNQGYQVKFESTKGCNGSGISDLFSGNTQKNIMGDGLTSMETGEFRSYYCKPTIYMSRLFKMFEHLTQKEDPITEYQILLDEDWFNSTNKRFTNVVYTLPDIIKDEEKEKTSNIETFNVGNGGRSWNPVSQSYVQYQSQSDGDMNYNQQEWSVISTPYDIGENTTSYLKYSINFDLKCWKLSYDYKKIRIAPDQALYIYVEAYNNNTLIEQKKYLIRGNTDGEWWIANRPDYVQFNFGETEFDSSGWVHWNGTMNGQIYLGKNEQSQESHITLKVRTRYYSDGCPIQKTNGLFNYYLYSPDCPQLWLNFTNLQIQVEKFIRSGSKIDMKRLWSGADNPFSVILKYCKLFNLVLDVNNEEKTIKIMPKGKYFKNYTITDWTHKISKNKDIEISPISFEKKFVTFNYDDVECDLIDDYSDKYKLPYGSKRINTRYSLNNDELNLLCNNANDTITPSCCVSEYVNGYNKTRLGTYNPVLQKEIFIVNRKDKEQANISGAFYFRNNNKGVDVDLDRDSGSGECFYISDDLDGNNLELQTNCYCWHTNHNNDTSVNSYPLFATFDDDINYCIQFSTPDEVYFNDEMMGNSGSGDESYIPPISRLKDVYTQSWSSFFNETYNKQNKKLVCYVNLSSVEYSKFKHNQFVTIDDVLYFVNKIIDYNPQSTLTKVELVQVHDINNYLGEYKPDWQLIDVILEEKNIYDGLIRYGGIDDIYFPPNELGVTISLPTGYKTLVYQDMNPLNNSEQKRIRVFDSEIRTPIWEVTNSYCLTDDGDNTGYQVIEEHESNCSWVDSNYYSYIATRHNRRYVIQNQDACPLPLPKCKTPVIVDNNVFSLTQVNISISCETDGATILYSTDNVNWNVYTSSVNVPQGIVYAKATKDGMRDSDVTSLQVYANPIKPIISQNQNSIKIL